MEEFDDIFNSFDLDEILKDRDDEKNKFHDRMRKEIGDRVIPFDYSSMTHENLNVFSFDDYVELDDLFYLNPDSYFIVISINEKRKYVAPYSTYIQDLIIVNPKNKKKYRIFSGHVKLLNLKL